MADEGGFLKRDSHYCDFSFGRRGSVPQSTGKAMASARSSLTGHIAIGAKGRSNEGHYFLRLLIREAGEEPRRETMSVDAFTLRPKETAASLKLSLVASAALTEFQNRVHKASQEKAASFDVATRPGWHDGLFVLPNQEIVGPTGNSESQWLECGRRGAQYLGMLSDR